MKKLCKILLSICMVFMLTISLTACSNADDDNDNNDGSSSTVTMTEYAKDIYENHNYTSPYIASVIYYEEDANPQTTVKIIKYKYTDGVAQVAVYDEDEVLKEYYEIETVVEGGLYKYCNYDVTNKTYTKKSVSLKEINGIKSNLYLADKIIMHMYTIEFNKNKEIGDDISAELEEVGATLTEKITNPSSGKYILTRDLSGVDEDVEFYSKTKITCVDNKVIKCEQQASMNGEMLLDVSYEYKDVEIEFNKELYTEVDA